MTSIYMSDKTKDIIEKAELGAKEQSYKEGGDWKDYLIGRLKGRIDSLCLELTMKESHISILTNRSLVIETILNNRTLNG